VAAIIYYCDWFEQKIFLLYPVLHSPALTRQKISSSIDLAILCFYSKTVFGPRSLLPNLNRSG